jgi:hypothetical protein
VTGSGRGSCMHAASLCGPCSRGALAWPCRSKHVVTTPHCFVRGSLPLFDSYHQVAQSQILLRSAPDGTGTRDTAASCQRRAATQHFRRIQLRRRKEQRRPTDGEDILESLSLILSLPVGARSPRSSCAFCIMPSQVPALPHAQIGK